MKQTEPLDGELVLFYFSKCLRKNEIYFGYILNEVYFLRSVYGLHLRKCVY